MPKSDHLMKTAVVGLERQLLMLVVRTGGMVGISVVLRNKFIPSEIF